MKIKILLACLIASTLFNGCKKDDETTSTTTTTDAKKDLLCGKNWMMTAWTVNPALDYFGTGTPLTNLIGALQPCELNNLTNFSTNNTYIIDEGATKCSAGDPQTNETGAWAFNTDQTHLLMTPSGASTEDYTLVTLNATTCQVSYSQALGGTTYVHTLTFTKQ